MKRFYLLPLLLLTINIIACSGFPNSFCYAHQNSPLDLVVSGRLLNSGTHSVQLLVMDVLSGTESRSLITIWDDKDFDCNGMVSMKVRDMGKDGDTILVSLPLITPQNYANGWDVIGDYRRPRNLFDERFMRIRGDTIRGNINSSEVSEFPYYWSMSKIAYSEFKNQWVANGANCSLLGVGLPEHSNNLMLVMERNTLKIMHARQGTLTVSIHDLRGRHVASFAGPEGNVGFLSPGIYVATIIENSVSIQRKKIIIAE